MVSNNTQVIVAFKLCSVGTKAPKVYQENISHTTTPSPAQQLIQGRMDPLFHVVYMKFWHHYLKAVAEIETY